MVQNAQRGWYGHRLGCNQRPHESGCSDLRNRGWYFVGTGIEPRDVKLKANVTDDSDTRVWAMLQEQDENLTIEFAHRKETMNTEDWAEVRPCSIRLPNHPHLLPWL